MANNKLRIKGTGMVSPTTTTTTTEAPTTTTTTTEYIPSFDFVSSDYVNSLTTYVQNGKDGLPKLWWEVEIPLSNLTQYRQDNNLENYDISIISIKSINGNIGGFEILNTILPFEVTSSEIITTGRQIQNFPLPSDLDSYELKIVALDNGNIVQVIESFVLNIDGTTTTTTTEAPTTTTTTTEAPTTTTTTTTSGPTGPIDGFTWVVNGNTANFNSPTDIDFIDIVPTITSGSGSGSMFDVSFYSGVEYITHSLNGTGYAVGDTVTILGSQLNGTDGVDDIIITITAIRFNTGGGDGKIPG